MNKRMNACRLTLLAVGIRRRRQLEKGILKQRVRVPRLADVVDAVLELGQRDVGLGALDVLERRVGGQAVERVRVAPSRRQGHGGGLVCGSAFHGHCRRGRKQKR